MPEELLVEKDDGDSDVVPEHPHHVWRQGEHLTKLAVVDSIGRAAKSRSDQVRGSVQILRFQLHGGLPLTQHAREVVELDLGFVGDRQRADCDFALHVLA